MQVLQFIFLLIFPYFIIKLTKVSKSMGFVSPILLSYITGIIIGNIGFIPFDKKLAMSISELMVPLAIPLILFATDFTKWIKLAKKTVISFFLVIIGVLISSSLAAFIFAGYFDDYWKLSGMLVGVYTGGTPNLLSVGMGLNVSDETILLANGSDAIMGGVYFLFLLSGAKWLFSKFLPPFEKTLDYASVAATDEAVPNFKLGLAFILAVFFLGLSVGFSLLLTGKIVASIVMLFITTLGLGASFIRKVREIRGTFETGQYLILIFSLAIGTNIDLGELLYSSPMVFLYTAFVMTTAIIIHLILAAVFRVDVDTTIITSTAGIYGPAFIGPVATGIKNREVILSGLTSGLVGYALGNYLGFSLAWILKMLLK